MEFSDKQIKLAEQELAWFFWASESECGVKSNFGVLFDSLVSKTACSEIYDLQTFSERGQYLVSFHSILAATEKARKILKIYQQLSSQSKLLLEKYFEERQYGDLLDFGPGVELIPETALGREITLLHLREPSKKLLDHLRQVKRTLKQQIKELIQPAFIEYLEKSCE